MLSKLVSQLYKNTNELVLHSIQFCLTLDKNGKVLDFVAHL